MKKMDTEGVAMRTGGKDAFGSWRREFYRREVKELKRSRLSYDEWTRITSKKLTGKNIDTDFFKGYIGLLEIEEVSEKQVWRFQGEDITVCDKGRK